MGIYVKIDETLRAKDDEVIGRYHEEGPWGLTSSIDLHECDPKIIKSPERIKAFVKELIEFIDMKSYDKTYIMDFGDNPRVSGISMFQFIETSCISGHFANATNSVYLDIFSCKEYRPHQAAAFCKTYFKARSMRLQIEFRE